ncbi:fluoride efflux transporter CrcB [Acerihabitans sp. TG2]|uniref:fluoride efflux transporter CrcB n=1 Tax=Acerihabitans sp. TG2 TaxID=3096008 RepID=UPI002B233A5B|nr:fluoride efflux transporter CrcB [Acerihabitans sp. TG2]MEA9392251.1 fluoride efflux transporter CrcB [Acerihabitans sp. TG2]
MFNLFSAVFIGGGLGSVLRWFISLKLSGSGLPIPIGTLTVNLIGAFIIGLFLALFMRTTHIDPAWKLLITTGFCGGLTTFSTFSAEAVTMMMGGQMLWAGLNIVLNLVGSLAMTMLAMGLVNLFGPPVIL